MAEYDWASISSLMMHEPDRFFRLYGQPNRHILRVACWYADSSILFERMRSVIDQGFDDNQWIAFLSRKTNEGENLAHQAARCSRLDVLNLIKCYYPLILSEPDHHQIVPSFFARAPEIRNFFNQLG